MDIEQVRTLTELMVAHDLTELKICDGDQRIMIRRGPPAPAPIVTMTPAPAAPVRPLAADPPSAGGPEGPAIKSPMVGTFYLSPDPESPPFVRVGSRVDPDTVVCIIEAMKVFNEIKAETAGTIAAVLVGNAQPVEYGQPLFQVMPG